MRSLAVAGLLIALAVGVGVGQRMPAPLVSYRSDGSPRAPAAFQVAPEPGIGSPLLAAAGLGLLGWGVGALTGGAIQGGSCSFVESCDLGGIFYGGAAGGGLGLAVGAHLGNRRRGSFVLDLLASGAVWGAGYAAFSSFEDKGDYDSAVLTLLVLPPTQLLATVLVERLTGQARARRVQAP